MNHVTVVSMINCLFMSCHPVGREIRDRLTGAVEAISRRNALGSGDHSKQRSSQDVATSRDMVFF